MKKSDRWQCVVCGIIHDGPAPPLVCPKCGAVSSKFVPVK